MITPDELEVLDFVRSAPGGKTVEEISEATGKTAVEVTEIVYSLRRKAVNLKGLYGAGGPRRIWLGK